MGDSRMKILWLGPKPVKDARRLFEKAEIRVVYARSLPPTQSLLCPDEYDAVILNAGVGTGPLDKLRNAARRLPIIVWGNHATKGELEEFAAAGASDYLLGNDIDEERLRHTLLYAVSRLKNHPDRVKPGVQARRLQLMQSLWSVVSRRDLSVSEQIDAILCQGCELFGESIGIVSQVEGNRYIVRHVHAPGYGIYPGQVFDLAKTFCSIVLEADGAVGIDHVSESKYSSHPCYRELELESYIGVPISVEGSSYGSLNFSSPSPVEAPFRAIDLEFVATLGEWMGSVLEREQALETLRASANQDPLTGLANRSAFVRRLERSLNRWNFGGDYTFAVIFLDLDGFKNINDTLGHQTGDRVLKEVARRLESCIRPKDVVARYGGDEFVVLLEDVGEQDAMTAAYRILNVFDRPVLLDGRELRIRGSIGVALGTDSAQAEALIHKADQAMYEAKRNGRGIDFFDSRTGLRLAA